jgi:hypothetical protein
MMYAPIDALRIVMLESCVLVAVFLAAYLVMRRWRLPDSPPAWLGWILADNRRVVLFVIAAALLGRACLLPFRGVPEPRINDEYSLLLMADTFAHHRLTNPTPAAWQHFETLHANVQPTYHSKIPVSQGLVLAFGEIFFHQPWIGVYLSTALLCGAICWALQAFLPPPWALAGGLLAAFRIALFSYWMNSYYGGSVAAIGGAVALGAVVRLFDGHLTGRRRLLLAAAFAVSLLILATSRPYEGLAFSIPLLVFFCYRIATAPGLTGKQRLSILSTVGTIGLVGILLMGYYNWRTTGDPLLLPYVLCERTYSPMPLFLWQKPNPGLIARDPVFAKYWDILGEGYQKMWSIRSLLPLDFARITLNWFFYVGPALSFPVLIGLFVAIKNSRPRLALYAVSSVAIALFLSVHSMPHYFSVAAVVVYLFAMEGLRYLWDQRRVGDRAFAVAVCLTVLVVSLTRETGSSVLFSKFAFRDARQQVAQRLQNEPGKQLVLVTYDLDRHSPFNELVQNSAELSGQKIIWARSKGAGNDVDLCRAYPDRVFWSVTTDDTNISLGALDLCKSPR